MTDLLDAVDALTQFEHSTVIQDVMIAVKDENGNDVERASGATRRGLITRDPILHQLRDRLTPGGDRDSGSTASPNSRNPIDTGALWEYVNVTKLINDWCRQQDVPITPDPVKNLRAWYTATLTLRTFPADWHARKLRAAEARIQDILLPPAKFDVEHACPVCGSNRGWGDMINGGGRWPIEIRYRKDEEENIIHDNSEMAICRACLPVTTWVGQAAIDELREEIKEKRHAG